jgi:hypothetical protein
MFHVDRRNKRRANTPGHDAVPPGMPSDTSSKQRRLSLAPLSIILQKVLGTTNRCCYAATHRQQGDLISLLFLFSR